MAWRVAHPQPVAAYQRQAMAVPGYDGEARVTRIKAPALVCHGDADRVMPVANAYSLAARIPGAQLKIFPGGGHAFTMEMDHAFNQTVIEFLK